jgi:hypothetical protein
MLSFLLVSTNAHSLVYFPKMLSFLLDITCRSKNAHSLVYFPKMLSFLLILPVQVKMEVGVVALK